MNKIFCVISHTHWDREWYMPLEKFRIRLVDLIDNLLEILDNYPQYIFHLDAQTIVLEDYLEIRPYRKGDLEKYIREGRILVGPWYVQNDFFLTSGEATIRNLIIGSRIAGDFGKCTQVGYTPDQFGLISQLPQLLKGFEIDNCIFGRGYSFYEKEGNDLKPVACNSELAWEGADGARVLAVHMPFWYNNAQRFSEDIDKSLKYLASIEKSFEGVALTPYLLLMNGVDHLEAQENLLPILDKMSKKLPENQKVEQTTMPVYLDRIREYFDKSGSWDNLKVYKGELRQGVDYSILQGTLSSRIYLKAENVKTQNLLECRLEPLYSFISAMGADSKYPQDYLTYFWKLLIQNHPHDSICGCSRDEVHNHMEDRFERIQEAGSMLLERGMEFISAHVQRQGIDNSGYLVTLFNTTEAPRSEVVELELHFPVEEKVENFAIINPDGSEAAFEVLERSRKSRGMISPINLPGTIEVDAYKVLLYTGTMDGLSYRTLNIKPVNGKVTEQSSCGAAACCQPAAMENEFIRAVVKQDGSIDLLFKETGTLYKDILVLEDSVDCGDSYVYTPAPDGKTLTTGNVTPAITCIRQSELETVYRLDYNWLLPEAYDFKAGKRSETLVSNRISVYLKLKKSSKWLEIDFDMDNASKNHRLRALINCPFVNDLSQASSPFDIITRDRKEVLKGINNGTQPNCGFINLDGEKEGISILTEGEYEYESLMTEQGTIAVTLLRATGIIFQTIDGNVPADETWLVPGNQCLRNIKVRLALYPHKGDYLEAKAALRSREFQNPLLTCFQPADVTKFAGGRPAVQDSEIKEIFFRPDPFAHIILPREAKLLDFTGKGVVLSAVKKSEKDDHFIIRLYNTQTIPAELGLSWVKPISSAYRSDMKEELMEKMDFEGRNLKPITLKAKEIITIALK